MQEIEKKRETTQMNKRLQRQKRNKLSNQDSVGSFSEVDQEELDRQIEHSMKVSFRFITLFFSSNKNLNAARPYHYYHIFIRLLYQ